MRSIFSWPPMSVRTCWRAPRRVSTDSGIVLRLLICWYGTPAREQNSRRAARRFLIALIGGGKHAFDAAPPGVGVLAADPPGDPGSAAHKIRAQDSYLQVDQFPGIPHPVPDRMRQPGDALRAEVISSI